MDLVDFKEKGWDLIRTSSAFKRFIDRVVRDAHEAGALGDDEIAALVTERWPAFKKRIDTDIPELAEFKQTYIDAFDPGSPSDFDLLLYEITYVFIMFKQGLPYLERRYGKEDRERLEAYLFDYLTPEELGRKLSERVKDTQGGLYLAGRMAGPFANYEEWETVRSAWRQEGKNLALKELQAAIFGWNRESDEKRGMAYSPPGIAKVLEHFGTSQKHREGLRSWHAQQRRLNAALTDEQIDRESDLVKPAARSVHEILWEYEIALRDLGWQLNRKTGDLEQLSTGGRPRTYVVQVIEQLYAYLSGVCGIHGNTREIHEDIELLLRPFPRLAVSREKIRTAIDNYLRRPGKPDPVEPPG